MLNLIKKRRKKTINTEVETLLCKKANFAATEAYKLLRTNLLFTIPDEGRCRVIGVTSAIRSEGKSTTSINLSYVLAETGKRVLLIDGDLRLPSVAKKLGIHGSNGLSEALIKPDFDPSAIRKMTRENWHVLPSGSIPPNPSEMLGSVQMKNFVDRLSESYDFIIVDLPPVNLVSDALVLSSVLDGMVVVVRSNYSEGRELNKCLEALELSTVKLLGVVMNAKTNGRTAYGKYKKRRGNGYYYNSSSYYGRSSKKPAAIEEQTTENKIDG